MKGRVIEDQERLVLCVPITCGDSAGREGQVGAFANTDERGGRGFLTRVFFQTVVLVKKPDEWARPAIVVPHVSFIFGITIIGKILSKGGRRSREFEEENILFLRRDFSNLRTL